LKSDGGGVGGEKAIVSKESKRAPEKALPWMTVYEQEKEGTLQKPGRRDEDS